MLFPTPRSSSLGHDAFEIKPASPASPSQRLFCPTPLSPPHHTDSPQMANTASQMFDKSHGGFGPMRPRDEECTKAPTSLLRRPSFSPFSPTTLQKFEGKLVHVAMDKHKKSNKNIIPDIRLQKHSRLDHENRASIIPGVENLIEIAERGSRFGSYFWSENSSSDCDGFPSSRCPHIVPGRQPDNQLPSPPASDYGEIGSGGILPPISTIESSIVSCHLPRRRSIDFTPASHVMGSRPVVPSRYSPSRPPYTPPQIPSILSTRHNVSSTRGWAPLPINRDGYRVCKPSTLGPTGFTSRLLVSQESHHYTHCTQEASLTGGRKRASPRRSKPHNNKPYNEEQTSHIRYLYADLGLPWAEVCQIFNACYPDQKRNIQGVQGVLYRANTCIHVLDVDGNRVLDENGNPLNMELKVRDVRETGDEPRKVGKKRAKTGSTKYHRLITVYPELALQYDWVGEDHKKEARRHCKLWL